MDVGKVRSALKEAINKIDGLAVSDLQDSPDAPCAMVYPNTPIAYDETFESNTNPTFSVLLLVPYVDTDDAQERLDEYLSTTGDRSVKVAIEADETLSDIVTTPTVTKITSYGVTDMGSDVRYLSAELEVELWT